MSSLHFIDRVSVLSDYEDAVNEYEDFLNDGAKQARTQPNGITHDRVWLKRLTSLTDAILALCDVIAPDFPIPLNALVLFMTLPREFKNRRNSVSMSCMLHYLVRWNMVEETKALLESEGGVDVNARDGTMATPLILVAKLGRDLRIAELLLRHKANVSLFDDQNMTAAHYAAERGLDTLLKMLATANDKPDGHCSPIHTACSGGHLHTVYQLLEGGADIDAVDSRGDTPLIIACRIGSREIVEYLLKLGAEPEMVNLAGESALTLSRKKSWWPEVSKSSNAKLFAAIEENNEAEILHLVALGVDVGSNHDGRLPLLMSAKHSSADTLKLLLRVGANANAVDKDGVSALLIASSLGKTDCFDALFSAGASLLVLNGAGNTALHLAAMGGHAEVVKRLIDVVWSQSVFKDVETRLQFMNITNAAGLTALECAVNNDHKTCVDYLVSCGAKATLNVKSLPVKADFGIKKYDNNNEPVSVPMDTSDSGAPADGRPANADLIAAMLRRNEMEILYHSVKHGMTEVVRYYLSIPKIKQTVDGLVRERTFVMVKDKLTEVVTEETVLYIGCSCGHSEIVQELLACGANTNIHAKNGWSCLFVAAKKGYNDIVNALIDHKADAKMKNKNDMTPLNIAAYGGFLEIVLKLIAHGADVNQGDKMGAKPIHAAVQSGKVAVAEALLLNGADVNGVTLSDIGPMYVAAYSGHLDMVRLFLNYTPPPVYVSKVRPCNIDIMNKEGLTPLIVAAFNNRLDIVNLLIERGADVNLTQGKKVTAIYAASQNGHVEVVKRLLQEHVDVNVLIGNGNAAVHGAAIEARLDVIKLLHGVGAYLDVLNVDRATPLYMACEKGHIEVVNFLIDVGKCNPNVVNKHQVSPMNIASQNGHLEVVKKLIASGGDVNSQTEDGPTPLFIAAQNGFADICRILVEAGAKVDLLTKEKESAIFVAGYFGFLPIVELLLKAGAQFNIVERDGRTPLWWACKAGRVEVVKLLLSHNADIDISDRENVTPLQIATTQRHAEVCELLMSIKAPLTLCARCDVNPRNTVSLPCRHMSFCGDCRFKMERGQKKDCPVCRTAITEFMAVYS